MRILILTLFLFIFLTSVAQSVGKDIVIGKSFDLESKVLKENREVFISLPSNYNRTIHTYPIIIVLDAEYLFEITSSIVKIKTSRNEMPESIIVGIPNNTGKRYDMAMRLSNDKGQFFFGNYEGKSVMYLRFFKEELFPFLEKNYRISSHKTIIGMSPSFGPLLEAFWNQPDLFNGYIILAAELSLHISSGETIAEKLLNSVQDSKHPEASIYIGKASDDLKRRPKEEEKAFFTLNQKLDSIANPKIKYKIEILENENHYGMAISGIDHGLETIHIPEVWDVPYRNFWNSKNPANELKQFYDEISNIYGFEINPLEDSFYASQTLRGTIRRLKRMGKIKEANDVIELSLKYYPNSKELKKLLSKKD